MDAAPLPDDRVAALEPLERGFYQRPTVEVALALLGTVLVREDGDGIAAVRITEVEAYLGEEDPACHTYGGRRSGRVRTMWGEAGHAYVYLIYGIHHCLNVVTVAPGIPQAVLIRGGVPVAGKEAVRRRRGGRSDLDGPGKLCQGLAITRALDGADLTRRESGLWIAADGVEVPGDEVTRTPRIGVDYAGEAARWPLRFVWRPSGPVYPNGSSSGDTAS